MVTQRQIAAAAELARRRCEALRIFRALPKQVPVFKSRSRELLIRGGNRSGKSTVAAVLFAALATNRPVIGPDGEEIDIRWPWQKDRCLTLWVVGLGQHHLGQTIHRLLFRPGLFKMIRDKKTGEWRAFCPWDKEDVKRHHEAKPAPPLIPRRYIKVGVDGRDSFAWENKGEKVFTKVEIWDPITHEDLAEIYAFSSGAEPKAGDPIDALWIDEHIKYPGHYAEWQARLIDRRGRIFWSSWPNSANSALMSLTKRAKQHESEANPLVQEVVFTMSSNPHLDDESKRQALDGWSEAERKARDRGEYLTDELRMYPQFEEHVHTAICPDANGEDEVSAILRERGGQPPNDWTRELVLDPGTQFPAVLLCAVTPPWLGNYCIPYDEIYIPRLDADQLAHAVARKTEGQMFERFIIDCNAGKQTPMGFGVTIQHNYSRAFDKWGLRSAQTGTGFTLGSNDVPGRILQLQSWMVIGQSGYPKLRIVTKNCPELCRQLREYFKEIRQDQVTEFQPAKGQRVDLAVSLEYWASRNPVWVDPPPPQAKLSPAHRAYLELKKKYGPKKKQTETISLGPVSI